MRCKKASIRRALLEDLPEILKIEKECFGSDAFSPSFFIELLTRFNHLFFVVIVDGRVVGYVSGMVEGRYGHVASIAVSQICRGKGLGQKLLERLLREFRELGTESVFLEVKVGNSAALRLYTKLGFRAVGYKRRYYSDGSDAIIMMLMR